MIGSDEYVLKPAVPYAPHPYTLHAQPPNGVRTRIGDDVANSIIRDNPTPKDRLVVTADIDARTTGELFLYVNDAVLAWFGVYDEFFSNNRGTGTVTVERIDAAPQATSAPERPPIATQ